MHFTATFRANPPPLAAGTQFFAMDVDEVPVAGSRPDWLTKLRPQERVLRRTVEQNVKPVRGVRVLDAPVPQMVDQAAVVLQGLDTSSRGSKCPRSLSKTGSRSEPCLACRCWWNSWWMCRRLPAVLLQSWPCKPWGGGKHELCLSSSTPPGQGGIQILAAATLAEGVDVSVNIQHKFQQSLFMNPVVLDSVHQQSGG